MATWPGTLPERPLVQGSSIEGESNVAHAPADVGVGQTRPRYTAEGEFVTYAWRMTDAQVDDFWDWYHDHDTGIAGGALPFEMMEPYSGDTREFVKVPDTRPGVAPRAGGRSTLTMQLYLLPEAS